MKLKKLLNGKLNFAFPFKYFSVFFSFSFVGCMTNTHCTTQTTTHMKTTLYITCVWIEHRRRRRHRRHFRVGVALWVWANKRQNDCDGMRCNTCSSCFLTGNHMRVFVRECYGVYVCEWDFCVESNFDIFVDCFAWDPYA